MIDFLERWGGDALLHRRRLDLTWTMSGVRAYLHVVIIGDVGDVVAGRSGRSGLGAIDR